jgi:hypothetical protein
MTQVWLSEETQAQTQLRPQAVTHGRRWAWWQVVGPWLLVEAMVAALVAGLLDPAQVPVTWGLLVLLAGGLPLLVLAAAGVLLVQWYGLTPLERLRSRVQDTRHG